MALVLGEAASPYTSSGRPVWAEGVDNELDNKSSSSAARQSVNSSPTEKRSDVSPVALENVEPNTRVLPASRHYKDQDLYTSNSNSVSDSSGVEKFSSATSGSGSSERQDRRGVSDRLKRQVHGFVSTSSADGFGGPAEWHAQNVLGPKKKAFRREGFDHRPIGGSSTTSAQQKQPKIPTDQTAAMEEDQELSEEDALLLDDASGVPPSAGSELHRTGACKPCLFSNTDRGCRNGADCEFCHYPHRQRRPRPCKGKRERYRKAEARVTTAVQEQFAQNAEEMTEENVKAFVVPHLPPSIFENNFLLNRMVKRLVSAPPPLPLTPAEEVSNTLGAEVSSSRLPPPGQNRPEGGGVLAAPNAIEKRDDGGDPPPTEQLQLPSFHPEWAQWIPDDQSTRGNAMRMSI